MNVFLTLLFLSRVAAPNVPGSPGQRGGSSAGSLKISEKLGLEGNYDQNCGGIAIPKIGVVDLCRQTGLESGGSLVYSS